MDAKKIFYSRRLENDLATLLHEQDEEGNICSVFHYQIPFPADEEPKILAKYGIDEKDRLKFYQELVRCVDRQIQVSAYLYEKNVPSVISYTDVKQERDSDGITHIYLYAEQLWPLREKLLTDSIPTITMTEIISRLAICLRFADKDTKEPSGVVHRGFDLDEVYINADNRIVLGGFYYAACPGLAPPPAYLPMHPVNIPKPFLDKQIGYQGTDILALAMTAWNLYAGLPYNAAFCSERLIYPEFATEEILSALLLGLSGKDSTCNAFRRKLGEARKLLGKNEQGQLRIPIRKRMDKQYEIAYI